MKILFWLAMHWYLWLIPLGVTGVVRLFLAILPGPQ